MTLTISIDTIKRVRGKSIADEIKDSYPNVIKKLGDLLVFYDIGMGNFKDERRKKGDMIEYEKNWVFRNRYRS